VRSCLVFDTACSRNDDFDFAARLLREKLSVCDLLKLRLNIFLGRSGSRGCVKIEVVVNDGELRPSKSDEMLLKATDFVGFVGFVDFAGRKVSRGRKEKGIYLRKGEMRAIYMNCKPA